MTDQGGGPSITVPELSGLFCSSLQSASKWIFLAL